MSRFRQIPLFAALLFLPLSALGAPLDLATVSDYLNAITTAETTFTQINADGSGAKGRLLIQRPGRMRFEYASPDKTVVLASGGQVAIFDDKSNQPPEQYPLAQTPLNLILGRRIDLGRADMVRSVAEEGKLTVITAQDPEHPEYGSIALGFAASPVALRQWVITDQYGSQTTVLLDDLVTGQGYPPSTFLVSEEMRRRKLD